MPKNAGMKLATPLIEDFGRWLSEDIGNAERTVIAYRDSIEFFAATRPDTVNLDIERLPSATCTPNEARFFTDGEPDWSKVTLADLEAFVRRPLVADGAPPSNSTRRRRVYAVKAFFDYLDDHGLVEGNPASRLRGGGVKLGKPKPVPDDVWLAVWDQPLTLDDRVMLALGYYMGFRRHEMILVGPHHFDLSRRRVANFTRKGGKQNDVVYGKNLDLFRERLPHLAVRLDEFEDALGHIITVRAGEPRLLSITEHVSIRATDSTINRRVSTLARRRGVHFTPHQLRHSFGTNLIRCGVPEMVVADQMAHSDLQTTRGYVDTTQWYDTLGVGGG